MIITDSLGAPRRINTYLPYEKTWPCLLTKYMEINFSYKNFVFTHQGLDSNELVWLIDAKLDLYDSKYVFLHVGIVDCARRVMKKKTQVFISMIPGINYLVKYIANKYHYTLTKLFEKVYVKKTQFKNNLKIVINKFENSKIFIIPILPVGPNFKINSYNIDKQIEEYNKIIEDVASNFSYVSFLSSITSEFEKSTHNLYMSDGYHINENAHQIIYNTILDELTSK